MEELTHIGTMELPGLLVLNMKSERCAELAGVNKCLLIGFHSLPDLGQLLSSNKAMADLGLGRQSLSKEESQQTLWRATGSCKAHGRERHQERTPDAS